LVQRNGDCTLFTAAKVDRTLLVETCYLVKRIVEQKLRGKPDALVLFTVIFIRALGISHTPAMCQFIENALLSRLALASCWPGESDTLPPALQLVSNDVHET